MQSGSLACMTTSGPTDARSLQVRITDDIRAKIESGEYPPGGQLPTYDDLAAQYQCSLAVARKAVDLLRQQGLVVTRHGKGSYVRERPRGRRHGINRYSRSRWGAGGQMVLVAEAAQQGLTATQTIRFLGEVEAPDSVAERLNIQPRTPVFVRRRTTIIENRPNQLADSYYPLAVTEKAPQIKEEDTGRGGGFARLEEAGYRLATIREEFGVRMPTGPETVALKLPAGTPVVELTRTTKDDSGTPIEVMLAVIAGDMITFDYEFPVPD
jgi:GntR family transcriptional regulator